MATVLILGGGFGGVVAAERLAEQLGEKHQITLVSRSRNFVFYSALVKLAFGKCERNDVSFDLRHAPVAHYSREVKLVIDDSGGDSIYLRKNLWTDEPGSFRQGRFWSLGKHVQQRYWEFSHS